VVIRRRQRVYIIWFLYHLWFSSNMGVIQPIICGRYLSLSFVHTNILVLIGRRIRRLIIARLIISISIRRIVDHFVIIFHELTWWRNIVILFFLWWTTRWRVAEICVWPPRLMIACAVLTDDLGLVVHATLGVRFVDRHFTRIVRRPRRYFKLIGAVFLIYRVCGCKEPQTRGCNELQNVSDFWCTCNELHKNREQVRACKELQNFQRKISSKN